MTNLSHKELIYTLKDIGLELQDIGFCYSVGNIQYTQTLFLNIDIYKIDKGLRKLSHFKGSLISDTVERLHYLMKSQGWSMWVDIHLYNDYHYNNGVLDFKHLLPKRLEEFLDIFRYELETGRCGENEGAIRSIKLHFEKWNNSY